MLTSEQLRAARGMLRWEQSTLSEKSGVSVVTIKRLERMDGELLAVKVSTIDAIQKAFEAGGIEFTEPVEGVVGVGVRLKWGIEIRRAVSFREEDGPESCGDKALDQKMISYWSERPKLWSKLSEGGRHVLSVEMFGASEIADEVFGTAAPKFPG